MLVLERKLEKSVLVGAGEDEVKVTVLGVTEDPLTGEVSVKLGFIGGKHICIDREEVRPKRNERIKKILNGTNS